MAAEPLDYDFFSRPSPPTPAQPLSPSTCPKCNWHQPEVAAVCAACGLIFAKYAAAEARRQAQAQATQHAPTALPGDDDVPGVGFGAEADAPAWGSSRAGGSSSSLPPPSAFDIATQAAGSAASAWLGLALIQVVPMVLLAVVGSVGAAFLVGAAGLSVAGFGAAGAGVILLAVVFLLVAIRVGASVSAGSLIMVDEVARTGETRGFMACFGDGFASGGRALGVLVFTWLAMAAWFAPAAALIMTKHEGPATVTLIVGTVGAVVTGVRLSLALPAAVLGHDDAWSAMQESIALTRGHAGVVVGTLLLASVIAGLIGLLSMPLSIIPLVGAFVTAIANAVGNGVVMGAIAGLWRRQRDVHGWSV